VTPGPRTIDQAVAEVVARLGEGPGVGVLVVGPGGWGTTTVLAEAASAGFGAVTRMVGRRFEQDVEGAALRELDLDPADPVGAAKELLERACAGVLLVDDAQWIDEPSLRALVGAVERLPGSEGRIVVGQRPAGGTALGTLASAVGRSGSTLRLGTLDEDDASVRMAAIIGAAVDSALVEAAHAASGGVPYALDAVVAGWRADGLVDGGRLVEPRLVPGATDDAGAELDPDEVAAVRWSPSVVEQVRPRLDSLVHDERVVLEALALGPALDDALLAGAAGVDPAAVAGALSGLRSAGLLLAGHDEPLPLVGGSVSVLVSEADRRRLHDRLARALLERGSSPVPAAEHLVAAGSSGPEVAEALVIAAYESMAEQPALAGIWLDRAVELGAGSRAQVARARVAAVQGDLGQAVRLADPLLADPDDDVRAAASAVLAAACAGLGRWNRAAGAVVGSSAPEATATAHAAALAGAPRRDLPALEGAAPAAVELAVGLATAASAAADGDHRAAIAAALGAADLLERSPGAAVLPETPHALGSMVALVVGDEATASLLLRRALAADAGGPDAVERHRLLTAWLALRAGRWAQAKAIVGQTDPAPGSRAAAVRHALVLGLARRDGDVAGLADAWTAAEPEVLAAEPDLLLIEPWTEIAVAAARLEHSELARRPLDALGRVVESLGGPALWLVPLEWGRLVTAVAAIDPEAADAAASALAEVEPVEPVLAGLAPAARVWADVLADRVDLDAVGVAVTGLEAAGRPWEASRLAGHAAVRVDDPELARTLLGQARELKGGLPTGETSAAPAAGGDGQVSESVLSDREKEVARLVLDGLTHKEVGSQLYISPKTVEHHVAKIRQKLGATTRAEMMAALRTELA
jgi:DNA-binding CsgD family transcriptional regulator